MLLSRLVSARRQAVAPRSPNAPWTVHPSWRTWSYQHAPTANGGRCDDQHILYQVRFLNHEPRRRARLLAMPTAPRPPPHPSYLANARPVVLARCWHLESRLSASSAPRRVRAGTRRARPHGREHRGRGPPCERWTGPRHLAPIPYADRMWQRPLATGGMAAAPGRGALGAAPWPSCGRCAPSPAVTARR